jgi:hypothetical protein
MNTHDRDGSFRCDGPGSFVGRSRSVFHGSCRGRVCGRRWGISCCRRRPFFGFEAHNVTRKIYEDLASFRDGAPQYRDLRCPSVVYQRFTRATAGLHPPECQRLRERGRCHWRSSVATAWPTGQFAASILGYPARVEKPALARAEMGGMAWRGPSCFGTPSLGEFAEFPRGTTRNPGDFPSSSGDLNLVLVIKIIQVEAAIVVSDLAT